MTEILLKGHKLHAIPPSIQLIASSDIFCIALKESFLYFWPNLGNEYQMLVVLGLICMQFGKTCGFY